MSRWQDTGISNTSNNSTFEEINHRRRRLVQGGAAAFATSLAGVPMSMTFLSARAHAGTGGASGPAIGFANIAPSIEDTVRIPPGYIAGVLFAWGDPVSDGPLFSQDASNTAEEQALQAGMHHDGMHFFPFFEQIHGIPVPSSTAGLLAVNHEYTDDGLLHTDGMKTWTSEKVRKSLAAHGVSIVEVRFENDQWRVVRPSPHGRRITGFTPISVSGPAAGGAMLRTTDDPSGRKVLGTLKNCAMGVTPWGTYLTCEENWNGYFANTAKTMTTLEKRYGVADKGFGYRWHEHA